VWSAVRADAQTGGRGRFGRAFVSDPGGLWISAVLPTEGPPAMWAGFSLMVGIHLVRMLENLHIPGVRLRWPNDLMSARKKLGGLLIEQSASESLVVGFGLNITNAPWKSDPSLAEIATSIRECVGRTPLPPMLGCTPGDARLSGSAGVPSASSGPSGQAARAPGVPDVFEIAVRTLDALADAHCAMQREGFAGALSELNRRWKIPQPVRILTASGEPVTGRFAGLDPAGNIRLLDGADREFVIPHQTVEKLIELD